MPQDFESFGLHDSGSEFDVLKVERQGRETAPLNQERIGEMDIGFGLKKSGEAGAESLRALLELDDEEVAGAERNAALDKEGLDGFRVADDEPGDGDINGILQAETENEDVGISKEPDNAEQGASTVDEEDGELFDVRAGGGGIGFHAGRERIDDLGLA